MVHYGSSDAAPGLLIVLFGTRVYKQHVEIIQQIEMASELETLDIHRAFDCILELLLVVYDLFIVLGDDGDDKIQQNNLH